MFICNAPFKNDDTLTIIIKQIVVELEMQFRIFKKKKQSENRWKEEKKINKETWNVWQWTWNPVTKLASGSVHVRTDGTCEKWTDGSIAAGMKYVSTIQVQPLSGKKGNEQLPPFPLRKIS